MIVSRATAVSSTGVVANDNRSSDSACANRARPSEPSSTLLLAFVPLFRHWCSHDSTRWEELRNIQFQPNEHWAQWPNGQWNLAGEFHEFVYLPVLHHSDSTVPLYECTINCDWFARAWIRLDCIFVNAVSRTKISISSWLSGQPYKRKNWSKYRSFPEKMEDLTGMPIYHIKETAMTLGSAQKIPRIFKESKKIPGLSRTVKMHFSNSMVFKVFKDLYVPCDKYTRKPHQFLPLHIVQLFNCNLQCPPIHQTQRI